MSKDDSRVTPTGLGYLWELCGKIAGGLGGSEDVSDVPDTPKDSTESNNESTDTDNKTDDNIIK